MSYILDALKKMEREKVKKSRPGMTTISGELFREQRSRPPRGGAGKIIAVAALASCVSMAATWFYLKPDKVSHKAALRSAAPAAPTATAAAPAAVTPQFPAQQQLQPPVLPPVAAPVQPPFPAATLQKSSVPHQQAGAAPAPAASNPAAQPAPRKADSSQRERTNQTAPAMHEQRTSVATVAPPDDIKVSGIAWQEERSARRIVVNGFLMKEGGVVSGARITEIMPDRVRFSTPAGAFELSMVASGIPGATK